MQKKRIRESDLRKRMFLKGLLMIFFKPNVILKEKQSRQVFVCLVVFVFLFPKAMKFFNPRKNYEFTLAILVKIFFTQGNYKYF